MLKKEIKELVPKEKDLCDIFIKEFNSLKGWKCYPETGDFDILVVNEDNGRQIGVEAKLSLNIKVAEQILPNSGFYRFNHSGPDHRIVIVRDIPKSSLGLVDILATLGVPVWSLKGYKQNYFRGARTHGDYRLFFDIERNLRLEGVAGTNCLFDFNPEKRIELPEVIPDIPAGVPSPVKLTPWKQKAIKVLALLRYQGYITTKQIQENGISPANWTQSWLDKSNERGKWLESKRLPPIDLQHPELYQFHMSII